MANGATLSPVAPFVRFQGARILARRNWPCVGKRAKEGHVKRS